MERIGLDGEGRMRPVLRRAVHARAEPHGDRLMTRDYPRIVVPPPGPKARAIVERQDRWASTSYPKEYPLAVARAFGPRSEEHTSELQSRPHLVCRPLLVKKKKSDRVRT